MASRSTLAILLMALAAPAAAAPAAKGIKSHEYDTERAGVKIALYEKWLPGEEKNWKQNGKVILLVHGATWSSHCTFDPVEGYSLMDTLAEQGYDVWAIDLHGYGKSGKSTRDWTEAASAAEDIDAAADYIRALRWVEKIHVLGYQWGTQPAGLFAVKHANKVGKMVFFGLKTAAEKLAQPQEQYSYNKGNAMLKPEDGDLDQDFVRRRAQVCMEFDARSPNGARIDLAQPSAVDPSKLRNASLVLMGDKEADANLVQDRLEFYKNLASKTKWFVVLSGLGKYASFEKGRGKFESALLSFLDQP